MTKRLRHRLIRWLARGEPVTLNVNYAYTLPYVSRANSTGAYQIVWNGSEWHRV